MHMFVYMRAEAEAVHGERTVQTVGVTFDLLCVTAVPARGQPGQPRAHACLRGERGPPLSARRGRLTCPGGQDGNAARTAEV